MNLAPAKKRNDPSLLDGVLEMPEGVCWNCGQPINKGHFCVACGKILAHHPATDYFAFLGLPRKLAIDLVDLERRFYTLSRKLHPDNFYRTSERERELSLEKSAALN